MNNTQRVIVNISMPPEMAKSLNKIAKEENKTKSELLRELFRRYQWRKDWAEIRAYGSKIAKEMGIKSDEDVERIAG